ncbi:YidB family protein [Streptosporangium lutulentum]|uniref:Uncharacterized protein YidB (DUF937 family) n=1 Tax=Streptosporangium lutulentum TaxID=1461250 RepID=A0ABT9Q4N3_9ACTN|nr:YidB family protein [Streptosporangium lutulentum]MDP9841341.1 uncharacterized protein YidB (DUF937 family) [Streptosporangium lutulentum]
MAFDKFLERLIPDEGIRNMVQSFLSPDDESGSGKGGGPAKTVEQLKNGGLEEHTKSWVGTGPNKQLTEEELKGAIDQADLRRIAQRANMSEQEVLVALVSFLPEVVDKATPNGSMKDLRNMSSGMS